MRKQRFPGLADLSFYRHRQPLPAWAAGLEDRPAYHEPVSEIDIVVNAHAGVKHTNGEMAAHNLLAIVRSWKRRNKDLARELQKLVTEPGCLINPEKRAAFARKWARRIQ